MKNGYVPLIRLLTVRLLDKLPNGVAVDPRTVAFRATAALETRCYGMGSHVSDNDPEASALMRWCQCSVHAKRGHHPFLA
jgi:hypothetical protein